VRMHDAKRLRTPASFFEAAKASTLLPELDRWIIRRLLSTLKNHAPLVRSCRWEFSINLAAQSLVAERFSEFLVAEICKSSLPAGLFVFEVAERDALANSAAVELLGAHLRDVGARLALDNCRADLETFGSLRKWPVSCLKIDGSLIGQMRDHARSKSMVRAMAQLASSKGIETVAECVESADVCTELMDMGLDYAQGFLFGRPRPLATMLG
jgi:ammonium transporter, Amt family